MSNPYGTESHDHEKGTEETLTHEQEIISEAPADYEFADDHGATADVENGEEGSALPAEEEAVPRRSPLLPIAAAVGGVLILGGVAWYQFSGSTAPDIVPPPPVLSAASTVVPATSVAIPVTAKTDGAALPVMAEPVASKPTAVASVTSTALPDAVPTAAPIAAPAPVVTAVPAPVVVAQPAVAPVISAAAAEAKDARIDALTSRIDNLQKALDQANQQLSQVTNIVAAGATPAGGAPVSKEVQDRIAHLEQQLESLHQSTAPVAAVPALISPATLTDNDGVVAKPVVHKAVPSVSHKKSVVTAHKASTKAVAKASPAKEEPVSTKWVLRAAVPGQAWVASSTSSHDLKQLQVGDNFAGIGRVTAIQQKDGAWSIQGTKGRIQ